MSTIELYYDPAVDEESVEGTFMLTMRGFSQHDEVAMAAFLLAQIGTRLGREVILDVDLTAYPPVFLQLLTNELRQLPGDTKVRAVRGNATT